MRKVERIKINFAHHVAAIRDGKLIEMENILSHLIPIVISFQATFKELDCWFFEKWYFLINRSKNKMCFFFANQIQNEPFSNQNTIKIISFNQLKLPARISKVVGVKVNMISKLTVIRKVWKVSKFRSINFLLHWHWNSLLFLGLSRWAYQVNCPLD